MADLQVLFDRNLPQELRRTVFRNLDEQRIIPRLRVAAQLRQSLRKLGAFRFQRTS